MDFRHPDYAEIYDERLRRWNLIKNDEVGTRRLWDFYAEGHYADFITDWGVTFDPRNAERGLPSYVPFILFDKQREWIDWVVRHWHEQTPGLCEKSRDMGVSWLAMALSCTLCIFNDGVAVGFGSRKSEYVDKIGTLKPLLPKGRMFMENLPPAFRGGWFPGATRRTCGLISPRPDRSLPAKAATRSAAATAPRSISLMKLTTHIESADSIGMGFHGRHKAGTAGHRSRRKTNKGHQHQRLRRARHIPSNLQRRHHHGVQPKPSLAGPTKYGASGKR